MKAVILAAGEGQRMRPLTLTTPKPLLKIKDKPIIEYIFEALPPEVSEVIVVVKYLGEQIKSFLGREFRNKRVSFAEGSEKGTAYSFLSAKPFFSEEKFLFVYGDEFVNPKDVGNCLKKDLGIVVFDSNNPQAHGIVSLNSDGTIREIIEKPQKPKTKIAVDGIMFLGSAIFDYQPKPNEKGEYYFTSMLDQYVKDYKVWPVQSEGFIGDITTPEDLKRIEKLI